MDDRVDERERLESLDRIWDLVLGAESEGQGFVPVSAIRAALTKEAIPFNAHVCDGGCR